MPPPTPPTTAPTGPPTTAPATAPPPAPTAVSFSVCVIPEQPANTSATAAAIADLAIACDFMADLLLYPAGDPTAQLRGRNLADQRERYAAGIADAVRPGRQLSSEIRVPLCQRRAKLS